MTHQVMVTVAMLAIPALAAGQSAAIAPCSSVEPAGAVPPADSPALYRCAQIVFHPVNQSVIDPRTYGHHLKATWSNASQRKWAPYDEQIVQADFWNLWRTNFLDDLWVEVINEPYANGVPGKHVVFHLEERPRIKVVTYEGSREVDVTKIEETLKERAIEIRLDSFVDQATIRRVKSVINELYSEKGYNDTRIETALTPVTDGPKLVELTFNITEGPKTEIREIVFDGNNAFSDSKLRSQMKGNRPKNWLSFITDAGLYQEAKMADDAQNILEFYGNNGYARAQVGQQMLEPVGDSKDGKTRWVRLRLPIDEGLRYRVGTFAIGGDTTIKPEYLRPLFNIKEGDIYSRKELDKGFEKARDLYGSQGYWQLVPDPLLCPRGFKCDEKTGEAEPLGPETPPILDVTVRFNEGRQFLVNRLTFLGNTTTHDTVIRREMRIWEGGVFNTAALKDSIRRLNQLGYFKPLEGKPGELDIKDTPGTENKVDVQLKVEEQNRNQFTFGAGISQYDGFFGNLSYTTSNFMGRGESLTVSAQRGSRASNNQIAYSQPYLLNRPISGGIQLFSRKNDYFGTDASLLYSEVRSGSGATLGFPLRDYTRVFAAYTYTIIDTAVRDDLLTDDATTATEGVPLFDPTLDEGRQIESRISPSVVLNTVNHPIMPRSGMRLTGGVEVAGGPLRGTINYLKPEAETILYIPLTRRTAIGLRAQGGWIRPFGRTEALPYYQRFFLGGEYQIRGVDQRTVGPLDAENRALGGNKFMLFNAEYYFDMFGIARAVAFHDAGQTFSEGTPFNFRQLRTSSGAEFRIFVPVLNVPFRLIYAWNFYRDTFQPKHAFKFAVGTTF